MEETKELNKVQSEKVTLFIHGKEREIKFGFSAWAKLEKEYKGIQNLEKMQKQIEETPFETIPHLLYLGLKDKSAFTDSEGNKYPEVTEDNILEDYGMVDIQKVTEVFSKALYGSLPQDDNAEKKEMFFYIKGTEPTTNNETKDLEAVFKEEQKSKLEE